MIEVRRATVSDAAELTRLRGVMLAGAEGIDPAPGPWQENVASMLRDGLTDDGEPMVGFVVDQPGRPGRLASCVIGMIDRRLGSPHNPGGVAGYVLNVATDPAHRRRGYSRACMEALLDWYRERGIPVVTLHASTDGEPLYRKLGFVDMVYKALTVRMAD